MNPQTRGNPTAPRAGHIPLWQRSLPRAASPLSVRALVSMPGRWVGAPARLRTKRNESAPDPPIGRPEGFWTGYLDSTWTLDQISNAFRLGIRRFRA